MLVDGLHLSAFPQSAFMESILLVFIATVIYVLVYRGNYLSKRSDTILEATEAGVLEWNFSKDRMITNDYWLDFVGFSKEDLFPLNMEKLISLLHPDDQTHFNDKMQKENLLGSNAITLEVRLKH